MSEGNSQFDYLLGYTVSEANDALGLVGKRVRVTQQDGKYLFCSMDMRSDRVNVHVHDGKITLVTGVG